MTTAETMPAPVKLLAQMVAAGLSVWAAGLYDWHFLATYPDWIKISAIGVSVIMIAGIINAVNFLDGINGLAGGIGLINALIFATYLAWAGRPMEAAGCAAVAGGVMGFLQFNLRDQRALLFLGDTG